MRSWTWGTNGCGNCPVRTDSVCFLCEWTSPDNVLFNQQGFCLDSALYPASVSILCSVLMKVNTHRAFWYSKLIFFIFYLIHRYKVITHYSFIEKYTKKRKKVIEVMKRLFSLPWQIIFLKLILNISVLLYIFNSLCIFAIIMYLSTFIAVLSLDEYFKCELRHSILRGKRVIIQRY